MLTLATYNILHGYHSEEILENIKLIMEKGADIICLQEIDPPFKESLSDFLKSSYSSWSLHSVHLGSASNLAFLWNSFRIKPQDMEAVKLPLAPGSFRQRAALIGNFLADSKAIRVANVHLSWEGGMPHRFLQLNYLAEHLALRPAEHDIICGDFNTFMPSFFRNIQKRKIRKILGEQWADVLPDAVWTCDISHSYPEDTFHCIARPLSILGFKLRSCLDYIFARNMKVSSAEILDLPGSDHRPLLASFE